jgi:hypothetical protein
MGRIIYKDPTDSPVTDEDRRREAAIRDEDIDYSEIPPQSPEDIRRMRPLHETEQELRFVFANASGEPRSSREYQQELRGIECGLKSAGLSVTARYYVRDAVVGGGGLNGNFLTVGATLTSVALVQVRKIIEAYLKSRIGRRVTIQKGDIRLECDPRDLGRIDSFLAGRGHAASGQVVSGRKHSAAVHDTTTHAGQGKRG